MNSISLKQKIESDLSNILGRQYNVTLQTATKQQVYESLIIMANNILLKKKKDFNSQVKAEKVKKVYYLCMEYLLGRSLKNNLFNLELEAGVKAVLNAYHFDLDELYEMEPDAALGNGGLGRLAACYLDSMATMAYPVTAYGIKYEYGLFKQKIVDGEQTILPDSWLSLGNYWLNPRPDKACTVKFGGMVRDDYENGRIKPRYMNYTEVEAFPYDLIISGYQSPGVGCLELWEARSTNKFDMKLFSQGQYTKAVTEESEVELISKVLYPADDHLEGKTLRLKQQYFLVSASLQTIFASINDVPHLPDRIAIHINDTHPALSIAELMRILLDDYNFEWEQAWDYVNKIISYTNHTIMFEALEQWDENIIKSLLPRIYTIIKEINRRFMVDLMAKEISLDNMSKLAIINNDRINMANLAVYASHKVNGVSALHTEILKNDLFKEFYYFYPEKFLSITNGVTHRRWLIECNPRLSKFIENSIGKGFYKNADLLQNLIPLAEDKTALKTMSLIKQQNKEDFCKYLKKYHNITVDPASRFDVQIKRIHEYKRQLLNILKIIYFYEQLKQNPSLEMTPQTFFFAGKAASTYFIANRIIKLITCLAAQLDSDPAISKKLKVVFLENYNVSLAEKIIPASDVSEQISLAGKEASGTGNMKFMLNGALTLGTYDGANIEMAAACGNENIFIFGKHVEEIEKIWIHGYNPKSLYENNGNIKLVLDSLKQGYNGEHFEDIYNYLLNNFVSDPYMCLVDFDSYLNAHHSMDAAYADQQRWQKMCLLNIANAGVFSSDRSVKEYAKRIWNIQSRLDKK